ncbi:MAG: dihydroxy-acid dehydratase [Acidimicrobiales bacterium]|nr:dihydroxy-acid dehydratase [Acidimicrobiales bacterium]
MTELRTARWYGKPDRDGFIHRSWMKSDGYPDDLFSGRPMIGICNSWSELTPCNSHLDKVAEHVKRGVWEAGGVPLEFPAMSLGETQLLPTAMLFRNLMSMAVEESIRGNPIDGVVLLGGCDKNTPAQVMGAASVDLPTVVLSGGPKLTGRFRGRPIGSGTDAWRFDEAVRAGRMSIDDLSEAEACMSRSAGFCNTMGTASTMASLAEAMGLTLPGNAAIPAADSRRLTLAHLTGRRIVQMVREDQRLSAVLTRASFENAVKVCAAIGGSTNAVVHLLAIAGRAGVPFVLDDWDRLGRGIPLLVDLMPSGEHLMEDFHAAGGLAAVMREMGDHLDLSAPTVSGRPIGEQVATAVRVGDDVIRPIGDPIRADAGIAVLRGNLAPDGAVIKPAAATAALLRHTGPAVVFESIEDLKARIDDPGLDVDADSVLVLKGCGPKGYPGMPEVGNLPLPRKLLERGVTDMVRVSDARMSGTAYGTVVLHTAPEAAAGGPLALVRDGDPVTLDFDARTLTVAVPDEELARRRAGWAAPAGAPARGYAKLYVDHVLQADRGADLDFLVGASGSDVPRESH